jgi:hypothetical protein
MRRTTTLSALAAGLALMAAAPASAHHGVKVKPIAGGLDNPRHVAVTKDGDIWVAESGTGGGVETPDKSCFDSAEGRACTGATGAITRIDHWGKKRVVTGLASFAGPTGDSAIGPHGVFADGNDVYFTNGGPTGPTRGAPPGEIVLRDPTLVDEDPVSSLYGTLHKVTRHGDHRRQIADLWAFENENNPDAEDGNPLIDSNPVDVYADHGRFFVADAGGNTVLRVGRWNSIAPVWIFENRDTPNPLPPPPDGPPLPRIIPMQAVPTGVVKGPDGALYVSQLTGFPFPPGGANVYRLDPRGGPPTIYAGGFTNIIDLDFGRDGTLYVLEIDADSLLDGSTDGALFSVSRRGKVKKQIDLPAGTLTHPGGVAVGKRGELYVTDRSDQSGDNVAGCGRVLKLDLG